MADMNPTKETPSDIQKLRERISELEEQVREHSRQFAESQRFVDGFPISGIFRLRLPEFPANLFQQGGGLARQCIGPLLFRFGEGRPGKFVEIGFDGKHSFEDTILPVTEAYQRYGQRISVLGGIDVDFLCRASEAEIRSRVRETLEACTGKDRGNGYCLGTGNTVANYMPVDNYLVMLDEGRRYQL